MKIGFFFAKQKLNVFVSRLALNLPKEPDGRRQVGNDVGGTSKIRLLPDGIDSLLELIEIRR